MNSLSSSFNLNAIQLNHRERHFLQLACSDLTYVQIADKMCVSPRTVDGYREVLFERLQVKSRVGLVLSALRMGIVTL
jgi:DNA-binding CsgD family transcriptional regulator